MVYADIINLPLDYFIEEIVFLTRRHLYIIGSVQVSHIRNILLEHKLSVKHCIWDNTKT